MSNKSHGTDQDGFDYMANSGLLEKDRDFCGMYLAVFLMAVLAACQYWNLY